MAVRRCLHERKASSCVMDVDDLLCSPENLLHGYSTCVDEQSNHGTHLRCGSCQCRVEALCRPVTAMNLGTHGQASGKVMLGLSNSYVLVLRVGKDTLWICLHDIPYVTSPSHSDQLSTDASPASCLCTVAGLEMKPTWSSVALRVVPSTHAR